MDIPEEQERDYSEIRLKHKHIIISRRDTIKNDLKKLTKNTQFIVITHRRGTMVGADRLYGITMQEKGISTLVSVKLIEDSLDK